MSAFIGFPLNLPYYLLHSLFKMSNAIKKGPKHVSHSLFHHGLVRMLIDKELSKSNRSWEDFVESNGFSSFCHCMFDNPEECNKHKELSSVSVSPSHKPLANPTACMSPKPCSDSMPAPVRSVDTLAVSKHVRGFSSPITPQNNTDKIGNQGRNRLKSKLVGRFTRSMTKGQPVKTPMSDSAHIETVVIDDEAGDPSFPVNDQSVEHEFDLNHDHDNPPAIDKEIQVDPVIGHPTKEKHVKSSSPSSYGIDGMMHPLFVNCLLEKNCRMEERVSEVVANRGLMKADNVMLKEKVDVTDKQLLRLKNHKNKLTRRVLKLQNENEKNEEKLWELNAQIALMQFKTQSPSQSSGVNIQVFNAPVNL